MNDGYLSSLLPTIEADFALQAKKQKYLTDPTLWAWDKLGIKLWSKQADVAQDIATGPKKSVAVKAGHGVGKSHLAAVLVCWWIDVHDPNQVFVASTAPSADQVGAILWKSVRQFWELSHRRYREGLIDAPLIGRITGDNKWKTDSGILIAQGRKPPDFSTDAFQGIHAAHVLAVGDEASGLNENMIDSLSNITSNEGSRRLLIANPTNPRSRFGDIFLDTSERVIDVDGVPIKGTLQDAWSLHSISILDSPNFHGGGFCDCPEHKGEPHGLGMDADAMAALSDQSYVDEKRLEYGEESARYKARVLGEFAHDAGDNLFTDFIIAKAKNANCYIDTTERVDVVLGMDVARSIDGDSSYLYSFTKGEMRPVDDETGAALAKGPDLGLGGQLRFVDTWRGIPLVDTISADGKFTVGQATLVDQHVRRLGAREIRVDSGGLGIGFIEGLRLLANRAYRVVEMQSGAPSPDSRAWTNNRAFQYAQMAQRMGAGEIDVDPSDKTLVTQLEDILFEFTDPHGAMLIESKKLARKRGVKSPDAADAAWYACADLTHLDAPKDGDVLRQTPDQVMQELILSGYYDGNPY